MLSFEISRPVASSMNRRAAFSLVQHEKFSRIPFRVRYEVNAHRITNPCDRLKLAKRSELVDLAVVVAIQFVDAERVPARCIDRSCARFECQRAATARDRHSINPGQLRIDEIGTEISNQQWSSFRMCRTPTFEFEE